MRGQELHFKLGIYKIRQLLENEANLYKSMRLEAIKKEPAMFRCTNPAEVDLTDEQWLERVKDPRAVFGLFANDELVGMTSILLLNNNEGYMGQSYVRKEHRGQGLSSLFYKIRMTWALDHQLKRLSVSHRESNIISKAANQRFGFQYSRREACNWQDGTTEDVLYYILDL
jgi:RimJ/RimL family protein N-acetyltransferase